jgi:hypothetical protein
MDATSLFFTHSLPPEKLLIEAELRRADIY